MEDLNILLNTALRTAKENYCDTAENIEKCRKKFYDLSSNDNTALNVCLYLFPFSPLEKNSKEFWFQKYKVGKATLKFVGEDGQEIENEIFTFEGPGVLQGQYNKDDSIASFARSCFNYALDKKQDLWFGAKDTISKTYDHRFKDIFAQIYEKEYKDKFEAAGITYFYSLIDDIVARVIRSEGGFIWACKNYDGDVMSDMVSTAFGSLAMMTSVLVSPEGNYEYEAAHGTVTRHYYRYLKGEKTSTNPMATIFAWAGALSKRGEKDGLPDLVDFGKKLEQASLDTLNSGIMTKDLVRLATGVEVKEVDSEGFIKAIREHLEALLAK